MKRIFWAITRRSFLGGIAAIGVQQALANGLMLARQPTGGGGSGNTLDFSDQTQTGIQFWMMGY